MMQSDVSLGVLYKTASSPPLPPCRMLPRAAQEIADIIGRDRALFLIGQLPVCYVQDKRYPKREGSKGSRRVILYVPKRLKPDHILARILGWNDAQKLVNVFGGEILCPPTLEKTLYWPHRDAAIIRLACEGLPCAVLAEWFEMTEQRVRQVVESQTPQEARKPANDNTSRLHNTQARSDAASTRIRD